MARPKTKDPSGLEPTPEVQREIVAFILAGGWEHVAAEAAGIPREVYERWMAVGNPLGRDKVHWLPHATYTPFWLAVCQAKAQARLRAEMAAFAEAPVAWLKNGPGKDRPNNPGWSIPPSSQTTVNNSQVNILLSPEMQGIFASILQILSPFPEARAAVALSLADSQNFTAEGKSTRAPQVIDVLALPKRPVGRPRKDPAPPPQSDTTPPSEGLPMSETS